MSISDTPRTILPLDKARQVAQDDAVFLVWVEEGVAELFIEPGWERLEPTRSGGVLFINRQRKAAIERRRL
jgi:hypothetical protein